MSIKTPIQPIMIYPVVYVLELEGGCWYIGYADDLNHRLAKHWSGTGAKWTKLHKPIAVHRVIYPCTYEEMEQEVTEEYIAKYGIDKVRGGNFVKVDRKFCRVCNEILPKGSTYVYCWPCYINTHT